jgi:hypothetical protein
MLVVGGMTSVTGAVVGCYFVTVVFELFRRWEVNGLGVTPPPGTANLVLAFMLITTLFLRPKGITGGRRSPWPTEWRLPRRPSRGPSLRARFSGPGGQRGPASAETPATE